MKREMARGIIELATPEIYRRLQSRISTFKESHTYDDIAREFVEIAEKIDCLRFFFALMMRPVPINLRGVQSSGSNNLDCITVRRGSHASSGYGMILKL